MANVFTQLQHQTNVLNEKITAFLQGLDTAFSVIAVDLPRKLTDLQLIVEGLHRHHADLFADEIFAALGKLEHKKSAIEAATHEQLKSFTVAVSNAQHDFEEIQQRAMVISERCDALNLFALNTRLATRETRGVTASAFRAITMELTGRARDIAPLALSLQSGLQSAVQNYANVKTDQQVLSEMLASLNIELTSAIDSGNAHFALTKLEIEQSRHMAEDLLTRLQPAVHGLMNEIQHQDIIRQGLTHIQKVLHQVAICTQNNGTIPTSAPRMGDGQFLQTAHELVHQLIADNRSTVEQFLNNTLAGLHQLQHISTLIDDLNDVSSKQEDATERLLAPIRIMDEQLELFGSSANILEDTQERWLTLSAQLGKTSQTVKALKSMSKDLTVLEMSMRITGSEDAVMSTETDALAKEFRSIYNDIGSALLKISECIESIHDRFNRADSQSQAELTSISQLRMRTQELQSLAQSKMATFFDELHQICAYAQILLDFSNEMPPKINTVAAQFPMEQDLLTLRHVTTLAVSEITAIEAVESQADTAVGNDVFAQLEKLISEFAVFSQKLTAGNLLSMEIEQGDDEGELTLF